MSTRESWETTSLVHDCVTVVDDNNIDPGVVVDCIMGSLVFSSLSESVLMVARTYRVLESFDLSILAFRSLRNTL